MTGVSGAASITGSPLSKWQLALAVGAPVALGLGYIYYKNTNKPVSKPNRGKSKSNSKKNGTSTVDKQLSIDVDCPPNTATNFEIESPLEKAQRFKNKGNDYFNTGKYDEAIVQYNNAIDTCPVENTDALATFYQNRAAAYEQLKKYSGVKADCTKALELKPQYAKALLRRARALEHYNDLEAAFEDVTAACYLGASINNKMAMVMGDRLLKQLGKKHAIEYRSHMKHIMPSKHVIKTYINSFHCDPVFTMLQNDDDDNSNISPSFAKILKCLKEQKYDDVIPLCTEEIDSSDPDTLPHKMQALLLRATFYLLQAQYDAAIKDLGTIINSDNVSNDIKVNALIKRGSLYMQVEHPEISLSDFDLAIELNPDCSDIYSHKGEVNMDTDNIEEARENFKKAVDLSPNFGTAYAQKCYSDYHYGMMKDMGMAADAYNEFVKALEKFPHCIDCYILFAKILLDKEEYYKADTCFAMAMEIDPTNGLIYVHKGWLQLKWKGDVNKGIEYITKAIQLDDKCIWAYEALGTIEAQRGNLEEALSLFNKALALCRTNTEITHMFSLIDITKTQLALKERFSIQF